MSCRHVLPALALLSCGAPVHAQLTGAAASIPSSMFGTFELTMEGATPHSPYPDETTANLTIAIDGALCAPGLHIGQPFTRGGNASTLYWSDAEVGLEFALDISGAFSGIRIGNANGTHYGTLTGERADETDPCDYHSRFFELAEANYPELFPESIFVLTRLTPTSFYRYYSSTDVFLGIANGVAFVNGGPYSETTVLGDVKLLVAGGVDELVIPLAEQNATANALFALAEQVYPALFPASALNVNQFDGMSLVRYYPASGVLVTVTGVDVYLSGGPYGSELQRVGTVNELTRLLEGKSPGFIPYVASITGNVVVEIANFPEIDRNVRRDEAPVPLPAATDTTTLSNHVQQLLRDELKGTSTFTFDNVVSTAASLSFDVVIRSTSRIGSTDTSRVYRLRVVYTKQ